MHHVGVFTVDLCIMQVYRTAGELVGQGGLGVAALLGPQAVSCALLELYGSRQSMKRPAEEGKSHHTLHSKHRTERKATPSDFIT